MDLDGANCSSGSWVQLPYLFLLLNAVGNYRVEFYQMHEMARKRTKMTKTRMTRLKRWQEETEEVEERGKVGEK